MSANPTFITFFKRGPTDPSQQCKIASNNIQDPPPRWILTIFKLKFGGGNLFSPAMTCIIEGNNSVGSLLKPLLKKVTPVAGFFFEASKYGGIDSGWSIYGRNHPHLLRNVF
jgi:hypothetical protein